MKSADRRQATSNTIEVDHRDQMLQLVVVRVWAWTINGNPQHASYPLSARTSLERPECTMGFQVPCIVNAKLAKAKRKETVESRHARCPTTVERPDVRVH